MASIKSVVTHNDVRRTYLKGRFLGKYYGIYDDLKTSNPYERFHNIKIYEGLLMVEDPSQVRKHPAGPFPDFDPEDMYPGKLPNPVSCKVNIGQGLEPYHLNVWEPVLKKGSVKIIHSQEEGNESFGVIEAELSGFVKDINSWQEEIETEIARPVPRAYKTDIPTGNTESNGLYSRSEYYWSNKKDTYWGEWKYAKIKVSNDGCASALGMIGGIAILLLFVSLVGWQGVGIIILLVLIMLGISLFGRIIGFLAGVVGAVFLIAIISSIISGIGEMKRVEKNPVAEDDGRETVDTLRRSKTNDTSYERIVHHRIWNDYQGKTYEADLVMPVKYYRESTQNREGALIEMTDPITYDQILQQLVEHDDRLLKTVYDMFDSIGRENHLDRQSFAEMTVSCIQDIPYRMVLPTECRESLYANDEFINNYLKTGKECEGNVRYGLFAPGEFAANLKGDCDTRTVLLFGILSHFGYDVAILSSETYLHSLLAISLPYNGSNMEINGQPYYAWETTSKGFVPGVLNSEIDNMNNWRVSLIHSSIK